MRGPEAFWERRRRELARACRDFRRAAPAGAAELAEILRGVGAAARAAGDRRLSRRARRIARRCARVGALESHRRLLSRFRELGLIGADAAEALDARWEELSRERSRRALRAVRKRAIQRLLGAISRQARGAERRLRRRLERARRRTARRLGLPAGKPDDRDLSRYRERVRRARRIGLALAQAGAPREPDPASRNDGAGGVLDRWHGLRAFRKLLAREREEAECRGAVTLALALDRLISAADAALEKTRRQLLASARAPSNVVSFRTGAPDLPAPDAPEADPQPPDARIGPSGSEGARNQFSSARGASSPRRRASSTRRSRSDFSVSATRGQLRQTAYPPPPAAR